MIDKANLSSEVYAAVAFGGTVCAVVGWHLARRFTGWERPVCRAASVVSTLGVLAIIVVHLLPVEIREALL